MKNWKKQLNFSLRSFSRLFVRIFLISFIIISIYFVLAFLREAHFCPKGSVWTGQNCSGTGVIPLEK